MASVQQLKESYKGEWLAIAVTGESDTGPREGELIYHSRDKDTVWKSIRGDERKISVTYAGPLLEEGYAVAF